MDNRDRLKEKEEIEELKNRIFAGEHADPNAEFERVRIVHCVNSVIFIGIYFLGKERKGRAI